jgi:hypothetical protein
VPNRREMKRDEEDLAWHNAQPMIPAVGSVSASLRGWVARLIECSTAERERLLYFIEIAGRTVYFGCPGVG